MTRYINRVGQAFGSLTVLRFAKANSSGQSFWVCKCECGKEAVVFGGNLHSGHTKSCGCQKGYATHRECGDAGCRTPEYQALIGAIRRCTDPNFKGYHLYGGRGIAICEEWNHPSKIKTFVDHIGRRPTPNHSLDRINNNGNYEPGNVRWATSAEQAANTRKNVNVTFRGETLCQSAMARKYGLSSSVLSYRLKSGWGAEAALLTPATHKNRVKVQLTKQPVKVKPS